MADYYLGHSSGNGKSVNTVGDGGYSPTRVGFKGTEDLGNGYKALFLLEYWAGNAADTNAGLTGSRQQYVGLAGNFGTITGGYQNTPGADVYDINAPSTVVGVYSSNQIQTAIGNNGGNLSSLAGPSRWANSVKCLSPNRGGLTFSVAYSAGEVAGDTSANSKWGTDIRYVNGPLGIDTADALPRDDAAYDQDAWILGVKVPVFGWHAVNVEYAQISYDPANSLANQNNDGSSKSYSVGYEHNLNKRTMLYSAVAHTKNDNHIPTLTYRNTEKQPGDTAALPHTTGFGKNTNSFMLGMRHLS